MQARANVRHAVAPLLRGATSWDAERQKASGSEQTRSKPSNHDQPPVVGENREPSQTTASAAMITKKVTITALGSHGDENKKADGFFSGNTRSRGNTATGHDWDCQSPVNWTCPAPAMDDLRRLVREHGGLNRATVTFTVASDQQRGGNDPNKPLPLPRGFIDGTWETLVSKPLPTPLPPSCSAKC
jgi:hypothetical protein